MSLLQVLNFHGKTGDTMADKNYLHTAYANSADGTNGFTTVYPNLNLLQGTNAQAPINSSWKTTDSTQISLASDENAFIASLTPTTNVQVGFFQEGVTANVGTTYTVSAFVKNMSSYVFQNFMLTLFKRGNTTNVYSKSFTIPNDNQYHYISFSHQLTATDAKSIGAQFLVNNAPSNVQTVFRTKYPKLEQGSTATPYISSASEVTTADWPKYVGTYVDTNPTSSTDPSKYGWDEMKYRVYLDGIAVAGSKLLSTKVENLKPDTSYTIQVKQVIGEEESDFSDSVTFKTSVQK